jgi:hypothetical protein
MAIACKLFDGGKKQQQQEQKSEEKYDPIDNMLSNYHLSRSQYGVIGKSNNQWILSEMLLTKWK